MGTTKDEVNELIMVLLAAFPAFKPRSGASIAEVVNAYHRVLSDIDYDLLNLVVDHMIGSATFFPSAGEIRRAAFHLAEIGLGIPSAQDAWAEVSQMVRKGFWDTDKGWWEARPPNADDWSHPLVQKAVEAVGGWVALRTSENTVADRARFIEAYSVYVERYRETEQMLPGVREAVEQLGQGERTPRKGLPEPQKVIADLAEGMKF